MLGGSARVAAIVTTVLAALLLVPACAVLNDPCTPEERAWKSPCPERFNVGLWCASGQGSGCPGCLDQSCFTQSEKPAFIPIGEFVSSLKGHDLFLASSLKPDGTGDPQVEARIDGVDGVFELLSPNLAVFVWQPFPETPTTLEIVCHSVDQDCDLDPEFLDLACEQANPEPACRWAPI